MSSTSQMQRIPHRIDEPAQQARVPFLRWTQRSDLDVPRIEQAVIARFLDDPLRRRNGEAGDDRFRAGRRGFDDAPVDADCNRIRVDHDGRVILQNHAANKDIGVCGMFWSTSFESRPQS